MTQIRELDGEELLIIFFGADARSSVLGLLLATSAATTAAGSNKTDLFTSRAVPGNCRGLSNVLVVTTSVGVLDGVHCYTTSLGPRVALDLVLEEGASGLKHGLVGATSTSNDSNNTTK